MVDVDSAVPPTVTDVIDVGTPLSVYEAEAGGGLAPG